MRSQLYLSATLLTSTAVSAFILSSRRYKINGSANLLRKLRDYVGGVIISINHFAADHDLCLPRPAMKCSTENQSRARAATLLNAACKIDIKVTVL